MATIADSHGYNIVMAIYQRKNSMVNNVLSFCQSAVEFCFELQEKLAPEVT